MITALTFLSVKLWHCFTSAANHMIKKFINQVVAFDDFFIAYTYMVKQFSDESFKTKTA